MTDFFTSITNEGSLFYIRTNESAPQYKVITLDIANDYQVKEFIPENEATLTSVTCFNKDYFGVVYKRNVSYPFQAPKPTSYKSPYLLTRSRMKFISTPKKARSLNALLKTSLATPTSLDERSAALSSSP